MQSLSAKTWGTMRLSWAQTIAGGLALAVAAGLLLLPGRLLGSEPAVPVAAAAARESTLPPVQAAPPLAVRHVRIASVRPTSPAAPAARQFRYAATPRTVVRVNPARRVLRVQRLSVIRKLAPTSPFLRPRVIAAIAVPRSVAKPTSTAKTIAALAASLGKK
jgi:hypothetical protein